MYTNHQLKTVNDWLTCRGVKGTKKIIVRNGGRIDHLVTVRGRLILGDELDRWLAKHPNVSESVSKWALARREAVKNWKHETPHVRYSCDGGSLAVLADGVKIQIGNRTGDGNYPVYVIRHDGYYCADDQHPQTLPHTFNPTGTSVCNCTLKILDYDCEGGRPMQFVVFDGKENVTVSEVKVKCATFYVDGCGAVAIVIE